VEINLSVVLDDCLGEVKGVLDFACDLGLDEIVNRLGGAALKIRRAMTVELV
jgi:hypothetical protein